MLAQLCLSLLASGSVTLAQSSTTMDASSTSVPSTTTPTTTLTAPFSRTGDWFSPGLSSIYVSDGMSPAAVSYLLEQFYEVRTTSNPGKAFEDNLIFSVMLDQFPVSEAQPLFTDVVHRLSEEAYLVTALSTQYQVEASSFYSVYYSLQGITPNASESTRMHVLNEYASSVNAEYDTTSSSTGIAREQLPTFEGALLGMLISLMGLV